MQASNIDNDDVRDKAIMDAEDKATKDAEDKAVSAVKSIAESEGFRKLLQSINAYYTEHPDSKKKETVGLLIWHNLGSIFKFLGSLIAHPSLLLGLINLISFFKRPEKNTTQFAKRVVEETKILQVVTSVGGGTLVKNLASAFQSPIAAGFTDASVMNNLFLIISSGDKRAKLVTILNSVSEAMDGKTKWLNAVAIILKQIDELPELKAILSDKSGLILSTLKDSLVQKKENGDGNELAPLGVMLEKMGIISVKKDEKGNLILVDTMLLDKVLPAILIPDPKEKPESKSAMQLLSSIVEELSKPDVNLFAWVNRTVQLINSNSALKILVRDNPELLTNTLTKLVVSLDSDKSKEKEEANKKTFGMLFGILIPTASESLKDDGTTDLLMQVLGAMERSPELFKKMMDDIDKKDLPKLIDDLFNDKLIAAFLTANPDTYVKFLTIITKKAATVFAGGMIATIAGAITYANGIQDPMSLKNIAKEAVKVNIRGIIGNALFSNKSNRVSIDFSDMELTGKQLKRIITDLRKLHGSMMGHSEYVDIIFKGTKITGSIDGLDLSGLNLSGLDLSGVTSMDKCNLTGATIDGSTLPPKGKEIAKPSLLEFERYQFARDIAVKVWENLFGDSTNAGRIDDLNKMMTFFMGTVEKFSEQELKNLRANVLNIESVIGKKVIDGKNNDTNLSKIMYNLTTKYTWVGTVTSGIELDDTKLNAMKDCAEQFFRASLLPPNLDAPTHKAARDLSLEINKKLFGLDYAKDSTKIRKAQKVEELIVRAVSAENSGIKKLLDKNPGEIRAFLTEDKNIAKLRESLDKNPKIFESILENVTKFGFDGYKKIELSARRVAENVFGKGYEGNLGRVKDFNRIFELLLEKFQPNDERISTEKFEETLVSLIKEHATVGTWGGYISRSGGIQLKPEKESLNKCWEKMDELNEAVKVKPLQ
ncbi:hypothetical protein GAMM_60136 [Gammaproteobacteria bacterium]